jgi:glyoxylase-like metal-dependent hydrolase (beta-lactamase superfamily II)
VLHGNEPVVVDTGTVAGGADFMSALTSVIDPAELRWIWLTHTDFDHIGSLATLLDTNPSLRVITSFLGVGIMGLTSDPLPMDRVHLINPGQSATIGDRTPGRTRHSEAALCSVIAGRERCPDRAANRSSERGPYRRLGQLPLV